MANTRIKDLTTVSTAGDDDYLVIDGETSGTRKILASNVGGGGTYEWIGTSTIQIDKRGVGYGNYLVYPVDTSALTAANAHKISAWLEYTDMGATSLYPLIVTYSMVGTSYITVHFKSLYGSPQDTSVSYVTGYLHVSTPFEISSVVQSM